MEVYKRQDIMGWQWHQLDDVQIICTSLQTDYHASTGSTSPLDFYSRLLFVVPTPTVSEH